MNPPDTDTLYKVLEQAIAMPEKTRSMGIMANKLARRLPITDKYILDQMLPTYLGDNHSGTSHRAD